MRSRRPQMKTTKFEFFMTVKKSIFFMSLLFFCCKTGAQNFQVKNEHLKGKAKTVFETEYSSKDGVTGNVVQSRFMKFNATGQKVEEICYSPEGYLCYVYQYNYNEAGDLDNWIWYSINGKERLRVINKYNDLGHRIETYSYHEDKEPLCNDINLFNEKGQIIEKKTACSNEYISGSKKYKYNEKGKLIEELHFDHDGNFTKKMTFQYNNYGFKNNTIETDPEGFLVYQDSLTLDLLGYPIRSHSSYYDVIFHYGSYYDYKYNYQYDIYGNWLKKWKMENDAIKTYKTREIKYYGQPDTKTSLQKEGLHGKVKSVIERNYYAEVVNGKIVKDKELEKTTKLFNEKGNIKEKILEKRRHKYIYEYDSNDRILKTLWYTNTDSLKSEYQHFYDSIGNHVETHVFNPPNKLKYKRLNEYNDQNLCVIQRTTKSKFYNTNQYDDDQNLIEEVIYYGDKKDEYIIYDYDDQWNQIEKQKFVRGQHIRRTTNDYLGNPVELQFEYEDESRNESYTFLYTYDRYGNWTKKTEIRNGIAHTIKENVFEYY